MKYAFKAIATWLLMPLTLPLSLSSLIYYKLTGSEGLYAFCAELVSLVPGLLGQYIRVSFYKVTLEEIAYDAAIGFCSYCAHPTARVGRGVVITSFSIIGTATLEDNVLISARVSILSGKYQHGGGMEKDMQHKDVGREHGQYDRVSIGAGSWIGEGAIVMASIGEKSIVSAGSVVTKEMPANGTAIGNPARFLKQ